MQIPPMLGPGARVALLAPSGPLRTEHDLAAAMLQARSFGWEPVAGEHVLARYGYLAGTDGERVADFNDALRNDTIDAIWCVRGGYGAMRMLEAIDVEAMQSRPRALIGFSDITALHATFGENTGTISYHGPNARAQINEFSRDSLSRAAIEQHAPCGSAPLARTLRGGRASGRLVGGNLAVLAALTGTRFAPNYAQAILVLEDVGESTYRIDRLLRQLAFSGALSEVAGIAFGQFTEGTPVDDDSSIPLDDILCEAADIAGVPAIAGIPMGHVDDQWTIPLGATAELDADTPALHAF